MFFSRHLYIVILCYVLLILGVAGTWVGIDSSLTPGLL